MEWLNTSVTFLNSPEFRRSQFVDRGVWLTLMGYCVQQENGGRITGTEEWTDWDWQQVLGVPLKQVKHACTLWHWEEKALLVHGYPTEKEAEVRARRRAGKMGGLRSGEARARLAYEHSASTAASSASSSASTEGKEKGKGRGKGKESEGKSAAPTFAAPTVDDWIATARQLHPDWSEADMRSSWGHYNSLGWKVGGRRPVVDWRGCIETCYAKWLAGREKSSSGEEGGAAHPTGGLEIFETAGANAATGGAQ